MGLRFDPVGGGQLQQALKQIIEAESQPIKNLEGKKALAEQRLKLFQTFKGKFAGIQSAIDSMSSLQKFRELKADLGTGDDLVQVSLDKTKAQPGTYTIEIEEMAQTAGMISNSFSDPAKPVLGIGYVVLQLENGDDFEVFVDYEEASLNGIANKINAVRDSPVTASVVKDVYDEDSPWRLILSAKNTGSGNQIDFPEFYFLDGTEDFWVDEDRDAANGILHVDGFELEIDSNNIPDFLQGVNMKILQARPGQPFTLTISEDTAQITGKMKAAIDSVNGILEFINLQNKVDESSDTRASFTGDTGLQNIEYRIRNLMHEGFPSGDDPEEEGFHLVHMGELGVSFTREGTLKFDENKFKAAIEGDFASVANAVSGEMGFAFQLRTVMENYMRPVTGLLSMRENGLRSRIKAIDDNIDFKTRMVERKTKSLTDRFARLQGSLASMQQQAAYLRSSLGGGGGDIVSQLMGG